MQEAFTRLARIDIDGIDDPEGWLVVVTSETVPRSAPRAPPAPDRSARRRRRSLRSARRRSVESGHARRQRHVGHACPARAAEPGGADVVRAPRRVPVLLRRRRDDRRAQPRRVPAAGQPGPPDPAGRVGGRPVPRRLRAATRDQRAIHRRVHGWRSRRAARVARPNRRRRRRHRTRWSRSARPRSRRESCATSVRPPSPTLLYLPVGDRVGIVALRDHRVLALILLTIDNGLVVHVDALAGAGPRAAVQRSPRLALT